VQGIVARRGNVNALPCRALKGETLLDNFQERELPGTTAFTDELRQYDGIGSSMRGYTKHSERVYVSGNVHTNTIEGFWSLVKNGLPGVSHSVSKKHL
jgi:transposase-like protein